MTTLPNGKTQQAHILQAVGQLTGAANISVRASGVKAQAFALMGIDPTDFEGTTIGNEKKARNPCDLAFNRNAEKLKKQGYIQSAGRGKYALTDFGWTRYATMGGESSGALHHSEAVLASVQAAPIQVASKPVTKSAPSMKKVTVMAGGSTLSTPKILKEDAHLLNMQKSNSPCFGISYSSNSKVCNRCPISGMCQRKRMGGLANLARLVRQGVTDGNLGVALGLVEPPAPEPAAPPAPEAAPSEKAERVLTVEALPVELDGLACDCCKQEIEKGTMGYIVADYGLVHEHCVELVKAQMGA